MALTRSRGTRAMLVPLLAMGAILACACAAAAATESWADLAMYVRAALGTKLEAGESVAFYVTMGATRLRASVLSCDDEGIAARVRESTMRVSWERMAPADLLSLGSRVLEPDGATHLLRARVCLEAGLETQAAAEFEKMPAFGWDIPPDGVQLIKKQASAKPPAAAKRTAKPATSKPPSARREARRPYSPADKVDKYVREPQPREFLPKLRKGHPRLILLDEDLPRIRKFVTEDPRGKKWYERAASRALSRYKEPPRVYILADGLRLLEVSRDVLDRLYHWCFMYRMEKDRKWLDRAMLEMEAVVKFKDWNPNHYLDTAEMMHALAIGYDWLYNDLTPEQRATVKEGLWRLGLRQSYACYRAEDTPFATWWVNCDHNWNFVCNGGTSMAAMALLDEMPTECSEILNCAYQYIQIPIHNFEPDGAWWEGVGYWQYAMRYFVAYLRSLETSFGTDFGFIETLKDKGFSMTGDFPVYLDSPLGTIYNFAGSGSGGDVFEDWTLYYLAKRYNNPLYLYLQNERTTDAPYDSLYNILYYEPFVAPLAVQDVKLDKYFRKTEVASMRSSWTDRNATFLGIKCGENGIPHAHQDLGSFIFYGLEERWLIDPGNERQVYQSHKHDLPIWKFYRIREEGHNTLVFNPEDAVSQDPRGMSTIMRFESSDAEAFAVADLSNAYRKHASSVRRGYRLFDCRRALLVQDEIRGARKGDVWWFAHSAPGITVDVDETGRRAILGRTGKRCYAYLLAPDGATFEAMDAKPLPTSPNPDIQNPNKDMKKLAIHLNGVTNTTISTLFVPAYEFETEPSLRPEVTPLRSWRLPADPPTVSGILVNGAPLSDFSPGVFTYTVEMSGTRRAPPVGVRASQNGCTIKVAQAAAVPGAARIIVTDRSTDTASTYVVRFVEKTSR